MVFVDNDRWEGNFCVEKTGTYFYILRGWIDHFSTRQKDLKKRLDAGQDISVELVIGLELIDKKIKNAAEKVKRNCRIFQKNYGMVIRIRLLMHDLLN